MRWSWRRPNAAAAIPDVQGSPDTRNIAIDKVGIKGIRHPVRVRDRSQGEQHTVATFNMYVELPHNFKGTHMSRFVAILNNHEYEITVKSFRDMLSRDDLVAGGRRGTHRDERSRTSSARRRRSPA